MACTLSRTITTNSLNNNPILNNCFKIVSAERQDSNGFSFYGFAVKVDIRYRVIGTLLGAARSVAVTIKSPGYLGYRSEAISYNFPFTFQHAPNPTLSIANSGGIIINNLSYFNTTGLSVLFSCANSVTRSVTVNGMVYGNITEAQYNAF